ncbi:hypothetical protein HanIR_Chr12g0596111 [Helianthus annuus]|nr:hypothetical protein HanIR_Chr12g0596111 [Helianthus annuus]
MVRLLSEEVTVPDQKKNQIRFIGSRGQKKVCFADDKPRATCKIQVERAWKDSKKPVKGFHGIGSVTCASVRITRR